ncbi:MAG: hypothetical protein ACOYOT_09155 [Bacteroidales bacterium]
MKNRAIAILHLIVLLVFLAKPILPYIEYALFKEYIAKNLCENRDKPKSCCEGKCFLKKELKKNSESGESAPKTENKKTHDKSEVKEFLSAHVAQLALSEKDINYIQYIERLMPSTCIDAIFIPPEV